MYGVLVSVRWQRGWRRMAWRSADLYYSKMPECRVVIVDIISLYYSTTMPVTTGHHQGAYILQYRRLKKREKKKRKA